MLRTGIDLIEIARIQDLITRYGDRFLERVFTPGELGDCASPEANQTAASLAARYAAKEATVKALGTGIGPITWKEVEIARGPARAPVLLLHGAAARIATQLGVAEWSVSLSHTAQLATAVVVMSG